jgi:hypothetical protein
VGLVSRQQRSGYTLTWPSLNRALLKYERERLTVALAKTTSCRTGHYRIAASLGQGCELEKASQGPWHLPSLIT